MNAFEKSQQIREIAGVPKRRKGYFLQTELDIIAEYLGLSKQGLVSMEGWSEKERFKAGSVSAVDMDLLLMKVRARKRYKDFQEISSRNTRLVPPSSQEFGVVDVGLTDEETTVVTIFNMLPKAMVEEAIELTIAKSRYDNEDGKKWTVNIDFYRE